MQLQCILSLIAGAAAASSAPLPQGDGAPTPQDYGFSGLINSRLNDGLLQLQAADVDSDGDLDLAVINNAKARIDFLLQRNAGEELGSDPSTQTDERKANDFADETHFRRDSFPTEQKVSSLAIA